MSTAGGSGKVPLYRKIYEEIRRDIASGIYQPGEVLPSIRDKAGMEGVARNTVDAAYQILAEKGLGISARTGPAPGMLYVTIRYAAVRDEIIEKGVAVLAEAVGELQ